MRHDPQEYEGKEMDLVYIARALDEARKIETILDAEQIDYAIQVEQYRAGVIFASVRAGAFFYVLPESAARCRQTLMRHGYRVQESGF
jgi:hypothetical protein